MPPSSPPTSPPPSKASLKAWWRQFTFVQKIRKEQPPPHVNPSVAKSQSLLPDVPVHRPVSTLTSVSPSASAIPVSSGSTVFGKPLRESLRYASVHISTSNTRGELYVWGYIPVVVAKWFVDVASSSLSYLGL